MDIIFQQKTAESDVLNIRRVGEAYLFFRDLSWLTAMSR